MFDENFLLHDSLAQKLYHAVCTLPIIDFHNHLSVQDLTQNRKFKDLAELWILNDPYKHRAMRICGVPERLITGDASHREKFNAWAETLPQLMGNALSHWSRLELKRVFDIDEELSPDTADAVWEKTKVMLADDSFTAGAILKRFGVAYAAPCCTLLEDVESFSALENCVPSLRGDDILQPTSSYAEQLSEQTRIPVTDLDSYLPAVEKRIDLFHTAGCRIADHALDAGFLYTCNVSDRTAQELFRRAISTGEKLCPEDAMLLSSVILKHLAQFYAKRSWLLLLHLGALRHTSDRLRHAAGPAGGFAGIGQCDIPALAGMLNEMESTPEGLPRTILFPLDEAYHNSLAVLAGSFPGDGIRGKVQLGPAWWYCDHIRGLRSGFENIAFYGVLSTFIGMTTDSRSILSFVRHEYFRRVFCAWLSEKVSAGEMPADTEILIQLAKAVCYENAAEYLGGIK